MLYNHSGFYSAKKSFAGLMAMLFCCILLQSTAQNFRYRFENYGSEQGLADRIINAIVQDKQGFIWIGSDEGLSRFDGYRFVVYRHEDNNKYSLSDNEVYALSFDANGDLWIGTRNGLNRYDAIHDRFDHFYHEVNNSNSPADNEIYALAKDHSGNLWIGTLNNGTDMIEIKPTGIYKFQHYKHDDADSNSISKGQVLSIAIDKQNTVLVSTTTGFNIIDPAAGTAIHINPALFDNRIAGKIYNDENDTWFAGNNFLYKIDPAGLNDHTRLLVKAEDWLSKIDGLANGGHIIINDIIKDRTGNIWIATNDNGVFKLVPENNTGKYIAEQFINNSKYPFSLASSTVYSLFEDRSGIVWIGTAKGLSKYVPAKAAFDGGSVWDKELQQNNGFIMSVLSDDQNRLWIGRDSDSLNVIAQNGSAIETKLIKLPSAKTDGEQINTLFQSKAGDIYCGTLLSGLYIIPHYFKNITDTKQWKHICRNDTPSLASNNIYAFAETEGGKILIGTYTGLCEYNPATQQINTVYASPGNKIASDYIIRSIAIDPLGNAWCATDNGITVLKGNQVLYRFRNNTSDSNSLNNDRVTTIFKAGNKTIWTGTKEGLCYYDPVINKFHRIKTGGQFLSDGIKSITEDGKGNLWIATNHGLLKYVVAENKLFHYGTADGLYSNQFVANASSKDITGNFYFGSNDGIIAFNPDNISSNNFIPPVVISSIKIFDKNITVIGDTALLNTYQREHKLVLNYNQNFFSFEFAALNYINSEANQYAYQLEGVDKQWVNTGTQRFAGYTDIKPGHYTFKVKAANNDGVWNENPVSIEVIILAPWWQTWWFYSLCFVTACAIVYIIYRVRLKQILKLYRLRSSIAKDLHDDVGSALSSIAMLSRIAQEGRTNTQLKSDEVFSRIGDTSKRMIDLMDDIVWSVNPDNDRFANMLVRMREYAVEMLEPNDIDFSFKIDEKTDELRIPMQMRKDYFLIFKEAVNNLAKYSKCSKAAITIEKINRNIVTSIKDNGKGFDPAIINSGNGLKNMKDRAASLKGKLDITTIPGEGSSIVLTIPVA